VRDDHEYPYGNLWFTESIGNKIGSITPTGVIMEFSVPPGGDYLPGISMGADGNLWFTGYYSSTIGKASNPPAYYLCLLYDPTKAKHSGATIPVKLELCDVNSHDLSSSTIALHAVSITRVSDSISGPVEDSGNANPDNDFRFDSGMGGTASYIFNLKTTGLSTGTYNLNFTVTGDSFVYGAPFQVK
jgi:hypothetical protein